MVEEAEARQHYLLTCAWYEHSCARADRAFEYIEAAADVFGPRIRAGDHTPHLLARLSRFEWPEHLGPTPPIYPPTYPRADASERSQETLRRALSFSSARHASMRLSACSGHSKRDSLASR